MPSDGAVSAADRAEAEANVITTWSIRYSWTTDDGSTCRVNARQPAPAIGPPLSLFYRQRVTAGHSARQWLAVGRQHVPGIQLGRVQHKPAAQPALARLRRLHRQPGERPPAGGQLEVDAQHTHGALHPLPAVRAEAE